MNIIDIKSSEFLGKFDPTEAARQRGAINYIETLASLTNTNVSTWDFSTMLGDGGKFPVDRNKINQAFFAMKESPCVVSKTLSEETVRLVRDMFPLPSSQAVDNDIHNLRNSIVDYSDHLANKHKQLIEKIALKRSLSSRGYHPEQMVEKIIADGFWTFVYANAYDRTVLFVTTNDVIIHHYLPEHGTKTVVNMGKYFLKLRPSGKPRVYRNPQSRAYCQIYGLLTPDGRLNAPGYPGSSASHPHVQDERVCCGELEPAMAEAYGVGDLYQMAMIIKKVLTTYNDESAYLHLTIFKQARDFLDADINLDSAYNYGWEQSVREFEADSNWKPPEPEEPERYEDCGCIIDECACDRDEDGELV